MKKTLYTFACIMAVAALTLTGCKKDDDGDSDSTGNINLGDFVVNDNGDVAHNGSGTLTVDGTTYTLNIGYLTEISDDEGQDAAITLCDEYNTNSNRYKDCMIGVHFNSTLATTGDWVTGLDDGQVDVTICVPGGVYEMEGSTVHFTRNGKNISIEASTTNVAGSDVSGHPIADAEISFSYTGSVYYSSYGL